MSQAVINDNERDIVIGTLHSDLTSFNQSINIIISVASDKAVIDLHTTMQTKTMLNTIYKQNYDKDLCIVIKYK